MDRVGLLVGDLDAELLLGCQYNGSSLMRYGVCAYLLDGHHDLNGVEAVETEIVREVGGGLDLLLLSTTPYSLHPQTFLHQLTFAASLT